jgi:hypothetical protein
VNIAHVKSHQGILICYFVFLDYAPSVSNNTFVKISPHKGSRLFRCQHFHGAHNRINLSTDHTLKVSRLYCLKKQFTNYRNKNHGGHPVVMPHDARLFSKWSGAVEPILLCWCNEAHDINTDGSVGRFLNLDIKVIEQMWDNMLFALQDEHNTENKELAHVFPNIKQNKFNVLYRQDVRIVQKDSFMGSYNKLIILFLVL